MGAPPLPANVPKPPVVPRTNVVVRGTGEVGAVILLKIRMLLGDSGLSHVFLVVLVVEGIACLEVIVRASSSRGVT